MAPPDGYIRAKDEVLRHIGRNVLLFQHVELILKTLLNNGRFEGTLSELKQLVAERRTKPDKRMFGQLIDPLVNIYLTQAEPPDTAPVSGSEISVSFGATFQTTDEERAAFRSDLEALVLERNELVHHALSRFQLDSIAGCQAASEELERQRDRILPVRKKLQGIVTAMVEMNAELLKHLRENPELLTGKTTGA